VNVFHVFGVLREPRFARLYAAQTVSQVGDALTWVALALLAYELAGANAAAVLAFALTLRVGAYVLLSPWAGVLADRTERRTLLFGTHLGRAVVIAAMPLVTDVWQVYVLMFLLNALTAFFTPTNQATVPLVVGKADAGRAFALSSATTELLAILGPGLAGLLAVWVGGRTLFWFDAATFVLAGLLVLTLPSLRAGGGEAAPGERWRDVRDGTARLWRDPPVRFALLMELVAAIVGALILTVTVVRVKGGLGLGDAEYGWVMALYGLGAAAASLAFGAAGRRVPRTVVILAGAAVTSVALLPADAAPLAPLMALWVLAGVGQNWVNLPTETLLAERTEERAQGRVYGAHFAWSHFWWALTYPLASLLSARLPGQTFLIGGLLAVVVLIVVVVFSWRHVGLRPYVEGGRRVLDVRA
jgi:NRE family putative nickel resistance protein-like MFS transporter